MEMSAEQMLLMYENTIADGASPKVMSSARESSSLPMGEDTWRSRAEKPSKKSKTAPRMINVSAGIN